MPLPSKYGHGRITPLIKPALAAHLQQSGGGAVSAAQSTLVMSAFTQTADGSSTLTGTYTARDSGGSVLSGVPVTFAVTRGLLDAAASSVTVNPASVLADGIQTATMTTNLIDTAAAPVVGVPSASVVEASTGTNNTITAVDAASTYAGAITSTIKSTTAQAKTLSSTVMGLAVTDTAAVTFTGGSVTTYATSAFTGGTITPYTNAWGDRITVIDDPTGSGRGKVVEITYAPASGDSMERGLVYTHSPNIRYGETMWQKMDFYQLTGSGNYNANHNRKIVDWQGNKVRLTLNRNTGNDLRISLVDAMDTGSETEVFAGSTGITLADNTWYTIEVKVTTNSADTVRDGVVEIYINGAGSPSYTKSTGIGWITENGGATYFNTLMNGYQLTINGGDGTYTDTRYFDNLSFSDGRL